MKAESVNKKIPLLFILVAGTVGAFFPGCLESNPIINPESITLPDTVTIHCGEILYFPNEELHVRFADVLSDSRCPLNVQCFWVGAAEIELGLKVQPNPEIAVPFKIFGYVYMENDTRHLFIDTLGCRIYLMELNPYPADPGEYDFSQYSAILSIFQSEEN